LAEREQIHHKPSESTADNEPVNAETTVDTSKAADLLDEIDAVLEKNAAEFVKGFVQKGGE
jgi:ubiquitin-like protein Pup